MNLKEELEQLKEENQRLKALLKIQENDTNDKYSIEELIDIKKLEDLFTKFSKLTGYTTGFVEQNSRDVLISTGWKDICSIYHRGSESSAHICQESNIKLTKDLAQTHQVSMKRCQHGMVDGATPIIIDGEHLADIFSGQVLFEKPNIEDFAKSAEEFGYDVDGYLKALDDVKIISEKKLQEALEFLSAVAKMIAQIGKDKREYLKLNALLEQKVAQRVQEKESLLALFNESDNVIFKWNNDTTNSISFVSESVIKLLGYTKEEFERSEISYIGCIDTRDVQQVIDELDKNTEAMKNFFSHTPYRIKMKDGTLKWILDNRVIVRDEKNQITHYLGYLSDISELKNYQERLEMLSRTDQLTKISNRLYLDEMLQKQFYRFLRNEELCSVMLIDIDYFKKVNDTYGHITGDQVLIEFAMLIKNNIRKSDIVGRWGGEEFLVILPYTKLQYAVELAYKLKGIISYHIFSKVGHKSASFGVTEFVEGMSIEMLLDRADKALYLSKQRGRDQVHCL